MLYCYSVTIDLSWPFFFSSCLSKFCHSLLINFYICIFLLLSSFKSISLLFLSFTFPWLYTLICLNESQFPFSIFTSLYSLSFSYWTVLFFSSLSFLSLSSSFSPSFSYTNYFFFFLISIILLFYLRSIPHIFSFDKLMLKSSWPNRLHPKIKFLKFIYLTVREIFISPYNHSLFLFACVAFFLPHSLFLNQLIFLICASFSFSLTFSFTRLKASLSLSFLFLNSFSLFISFVYKRLCSPRFHPIYLTIYFS